MWIMLPDAFLSIVDKDCPPGKLLVRARRPGDIQRVFGKVRVERTEDADYLFRACVTRVAVKAALARQVALIDYPNFKSTVRDDDLHRAYHGVWSAMAAVQDPPPYSKPYKTAKPGAKKR